jgi:hypothetical protein
MALMFIEVTASMIATVPFKVTVAISLALIWTNADKFSITTNTGILTYAEKQTSAHNNDTVTIVATDVAGNKAERLITVSVKDTLLKDDGTNVY